MDDKLKELIQKHAEKNGFTYKEGIELYTGFNDEVNKVVQEFNTNNYKEIRIPWLMRMVWSETRYNKLLKTNPELVVYSPPTNSLIIEENEINESKFKD